MTLLMAVIAAVVSTIVWYVNAGARKLGVGKLSLMYWGASLMWLVDAVIEYAEMRAAYFTPAPADMLSDGFLGVCVVALGLVIWLVTVLIKDPSGVIREALRKKA